MNCPILSSGGWRQIGVPTQQYHRGVRFNVRIFCNDVSPFLFRVRRFVGLDVPVLSLLVPLKFPIVGYTAVFCCHFRPLRAHLNRHAGNLALLLAA